MIDCLKSKWWRHYLGITVGVGFSAVALNMFLIPNKIAAGGITGLATILHYFIGVPVGMTTLALNVPLIFISMRLFGMKFGVNTLFGAVLLSVAIDLTAPFIPVLTNDLLLSAIFGGILDGIGIGLVFRFNGTTAGTDLAAAIINRFTKLSLGQALLAIDFFVITTAGIAFARVELALYALIALFVTTQMVDLVQEGRSTAKAFFIMTDKTESLTEVILNDLDRGVTCIEGRGGYTKNVRDVLLCVVPTSQVTVLKNIIAEIDSRAFVIVTDAHDVMGEGFQPLKNKGG